MLRFVFPTEDSRQDVQSFYNEFKSDGGTCIDYGGYKNFDRWLARMNNRISGKNLPAGYVRENFYLCYDGDDMVDVFNLKFELTTSAGISDTRSSRRAETGAAPRRC